MAVKEYKCPACGAPLPFDATTQTLHCENCGNEYDISTLEALRQADEDAETEDLSWDGFLQDTTGYEKLENTVIYYCKSCGAILETDENTVATTCPYCGNNVVLTDRVSAGLKPDAIIPFKIDKKGLIDRIREFQKDKKLLPKNFFSESMLGKLMGMYVPFWLYSAEVSGNVAMDATRTTSFRAGQYNVTDTSHYLLERAGDMYFENVPVDASKKLDNDLMDSVEPYDLSELTEFKQAYLSGYVADRYDISPEEERRRAESRMLNTAGEYFESTAGSYGSVRLRSKNLRTSGVTVRYVLLPVYLINCKFAGNDYRFAVNGQSGKIIGELPTSKERMAHYFFATFLPIFLGIMGISLLVYFFA